MLIMLAVCLDFEIDPKSLYAFLPIMQKNASDSLANVLGCHQLDVTQDPQSPKKVFLCEFYDDEVDFKLHKKASHYLEFNQLVSEVVTTKSVRLLKNDQSLTQSLVVKKRMQ